MHGNLRPCHWSNNGSYTYTLGMLVLLNSFSSNVCWWKYIIYVKVLEWQGLKEDLYQNKHLRGADSTKGYEHHDFVHIFHKL